jgi:CobQ-like glutamine amidotransferase family enzyme
MADHQSLGCDGNALVIASRAKQRGVPVSIRRGHGTEALPEADIYFLGGAPTRDQSYLVDHLRNDNRFLDRVHSGAVLFAVNSGFEILGNTFETVDGDTERGLGLIDFSIHRDHLAEGPVVTTPGGLLDLPAISGFETHTGRCTIGTKVNPLSHIEIGIGSGDEDRTEGVVADHIIGTYVHGPILARNPELADVVLGWALGRSLEPLGPGAAEKLRDQHINEDRTDPTGWGGRQYGIVSPRAKLRGMARRH